MGSVSCGSDKRHKRRDASELGSLWRTDLGFALERRHVGIELAQYIKVWTSQLSVDARFWKNPFTTR